MHENLDGRAAFQDSPHGAIVFGPLLQQHVIDNGPVGGLVFQEHNAKLIDVYAKMDITEAPKRVVVEAYVAASPVATKGEAKLGTLDVGGELENNGMLAHAPSPAEFAGGIFAVQIRVYSVGRVSAGYVGAVLRRVGDALDFFGRIVRVGIQKADDVGDVLVGEARVLFSQASRVEGILGGCTGEQSDKTALYRKARRGTDGGQTLLSSLLRILIWVLHWSRRRKAGCFERGRSHDTSTPRCGPTTAAQYILFFIWISSVYRLHDGAPSSRHGNATR